MHTIISGRIGKPVSPVCGIEVVAGLAVGAGVAAAVGAWVGAGVEEEEPLEELVFPPDGAAVVPGVCFGGSVGAVVGGFVGAGAGWLFAFQLTPNGESECTVTANLPSFTCGVSNSTVPSSFKWLIRKSYSSAVVPSGKANRTSMPSGMFSLAAGCQLAPPSVLTVSVTSYTFMVSVSSFVAISLLSLLSTASGVL